MTSKQKRQLKKEFTPKYYKNVNIWGAVALCAVFIIGLCVCIAVGVTFDESPVTYITMIVYFFVLIVMLIVWMVIALKARKKLILQRTEEIESEFSDLNFDEVTASLSQKRVITEHGFVANLGEYAGMLVVPFKEATVFVYSANIYTKICSAVRITNASGAIIAERILDNELFNFICKKGVNRKFVADSGLLINHKKEFVKVHIKGSGERKTWGFLFGAVGMLISDEANGVSLSRKTVLNILGREMQE